MHRLDLVAIAIEPLSGRKKEVFTTMPGLQLYIAKWIKNVKGKEDQICKEREVFLCRNSKFSRRN